ncbi:MAG TPA: hypothetical protein VL147_01565 [Devosia sp.]|nr:hypothetical protein [Devosia sp.]
MILQVLAVWLIVMTTIVWFMRDEKRRRDGALSAQALAYAKAPHYRHPAPAESAPPMPIARQAGLRAADRAYFEVLRGNDPV